MKLEAVLFDLDGTLIDTAADFVRTLNILCKRYNIKSPSDTAIRNTVSDGARALIKLAFKKEPGSEDFEQLREELLDIYTNELGKDTPLFKHMDKVLAHLCKHDIPWGIVTNKPRLYTELLLQRIKLSIKPDTVICPDDVKQAKPAPDAIFLACKQLGVKAANSLYIGDHLRDIEAGKAAKTKTISCAWGYFDPQTNLELWDADYIAKDCEHLLTLIQGLN